MPTTATRKKAAFEAAERFFLSMLMAYLLPLPGFEGGGRDEQGHRDDRGVVDEVSRVDDPAAHVLEVRVRAEKRDDPLQLFGHERQDLSEEEQREADAERDD